jgi:hypothetical protein
MVILSGTRCQVYEEEVTMQRIFTPLGEAILSFVLVFVVGFGSYYYFR